METAGVGHNTSHELHKPQKKTEEHHSKPPVDHQENKEPKKTDGDKKTHETHDTHETHKTEPPKKPEPHHETHPKGKSHEGDHLGSLVDVAA